METVRSFSEVSTLRLSRSESISQTLELREAGVPSIHIHAQHSTNSAAAIANQVY